MLQHCHLGSPTICHKLPFRKAVFIRNRMDLQFGALGTSFACDVRDSSRVLSKIMFTYRLFLVVLFFSSLLKCTFTCYILANLVNEKFDKLTLIE